MRQSLGILIAIAGVLIMAGSAGDCDGKCIDQANTISEMLMIAGIGMVMSIAGIVVATVKS